MRNVPKIVTARLQRSALPKAEAHPDADLLTAFAERALPGREREQVVEHLARCGDCREIIALALPASEEASPTHLAATTRSSWMSWPVLRWGVVTAGIVAVTFVGALQYTQRSRTKTLVAVNSSVRHQAPEAQGAPIQPAPAAPAALPRQAAGPAQPEVLKQTVAGEQKPTSSPRSVSAANRVPTPNAIFPPSQPLHTATAGGTFRGSIPPGHSVGRASTNAVRTTAGADLGASVAQASPQSLETAQSAPGPLEGERLEVNKAKSPPKEAFAFRMATAPPMRIDPTLLKTAAGLRWAISVNGALQRSLDGGQTWVEINVNSNSGPAVAGMNFADASNGSAYGSIVGTITDPSGAVISGAALILTNLSTAEKRTQSAGSDGRFAFTSLLPGQYRIDVKAAGFSLMQSTIAINSQQNQHFDARLQVGTTSTVVEVTGEAPVLDVETTAANTTAPALAKKSDTRQEQRDQKNEVERRKISFSTPNPVFHALAANGPDVWAGGSGGALYHTIDGGSRWTRVAPSAAGIALTGDIVNIQFSDLHNGTVTTSTAEVWTTSDEGQTWNKRR